jgi:hypothetical protein
LPEHVIAFAVIQPHPLRPNNDIFVKKMSGEMEAGGNPEIMQVWQMEGTTLQSRHPEKDERAFSEEQGNSQAVCL